MKFNGNLAILIKKDFITFLYTKAKYLKTYDGKFNTIFHNYQMPKEGPQCICIPVILIYFVFEMSKNYYPRVLLEECKYIGK